MHLVPIDVCSSEYLMNIPVNNVQNKLSAQLERFVGQHYGLVDDLCRSK